MTKKRLFCFVLICFIAFSCTKYTPVEHKFETLDKVEAISKLAPFLLDSVYKDNGIFFSTAMQNEKWFARDYFKGFPEEFEKNYVLTKIYPTNWGEYRIVYSNKTCTNEEEKCVSSLLFAIGPPKKTNTPDKVIFSCKLEKNKETFYQLSAFPISILFFMKGDGRADYFAGLEDVYMADFTKYEKLIQMVKSIYPEYKIDCW